MAKWRLRLFWAILLALLAAFGTNSYLSSLQKTEPVVVAARDIAARAEVTSEMIKVIQVSRADRETLAAGAFQSPSEVLGRYARRPMEAGEVLRNKPGDFFAPGEVRPAPEGAEAALADSLPPNTRAVTLQLDAQAVASKHLRPGDRADVIFTSKSDSTGGVYASMLVQQAWVLDVVRPVDTGDDKILVTLLVTPEQAVDLSLAKRTGSIDLAINPPDPGEPIRTQAVSPLKFIGQTNAPPGQVETRFKDAAEQAGAKSPR